MFSENDWLNNFCNHISSIIWTLGESFDFQVQFFFITNAVTAIRFVNSKKNHFPLELHKRTLNYSPAISYSD